MYIKTLLTSFLKSFFSLISLSTCFICQTGRKNICDTCLLQCSQTVYTRKNGEKNISLSYKDKNVKTILRFAKYNHAHSLYKELTNYVFQKNKTKLLLLEKPLIIPIPMHFLRKLFRGQNHAEHIALYLHGYMQSELMKKCLLKKQYTQRQALIGRSKRLSYQKNSFILNSRQKETLYHRNIILVDDIITTGSTIEEATRALEKAHPKSITIFTLAH